MTAVRNLRKIWGVARTEYVNWITNPRIMILGVLLVFMKNLVIDPLSARADKFGDTMVIFEPYIAITNSSRLMLFIPLLFLILLSDYPKFGGNSMFFISRTGKKNWLCGQIVFLIMAIVTFMGAIFAVSILLSGGHFGTEWSEAVRKYAARFPEESGNFDSELLPSNLYNQIPMMTALWQSSLLLFEYLLSLSLIIYLAKILFGGAVGLGGAVLVIAVGSAAQYSPLKWAFPAANTIIWRHYTEFLRELVYPMWASFLYLGAMPLLLIFGCFIALKKLKFTENR